MQMGNLVVQTGLEVKDICFSGSEYAQFISIINGATSQALYAGLVIGAAAAAIGIFGAVFFLKMAKDKDWLNYGED